MLKPGLVFTSLVEKIEYERGSLQPIATIINRPNGVGLRKLIHESLKEWIQPFGPIRLYRIHKRQYGVTVRFDASRYEIASIVQCINLGA